jgi:hypothetical protein
MFHVKRITLELLISFANIGIYSKFALFLRLITFTNFIHNLKILPRFYTNLYYIV